MRLIELKCQNCGSLLKIDPEKNEATCEYCGAKYALDDEVQHVHYDNAEQAGYEFEKGRQKAMSETCRAAQTGYAQQKNPHTWLWVAGWIILFPVPVTILVARSRTMPQWLKGVLIGAAWVAYIALVIVGKMKD